MAIPTDKQMIECETSDGTTELVPAIDESWVEAREYGRFYILKSDLFGTLHETTWLKQMGELEGSLQYLRLLDHHTFWSTIIYDPEPLHMIDSYLKQCPRYTDAALSAMFFHGRFTDIKDKMKSLHVNVMRVLLRMMVPKESEENSLSAEFFARTIYDHKIMTITRIMDICSVFAVDNLKILQRTIGQLFKLQPAFLDDLKTDAEIVIQLLEKAASEAERAAANQSRQRVFHMKTTELDMQSIVELCAYIIDVAGSLTVLVVVLPESLRVFHQVGLTAELPSFTERLCVSLAAELFFRIAKSGFQVNVRLLIGQLESFKLSAVRLYRLLLEKNAMYDAQLPAAEAKKRSEEFVTLITKALNCENFIFVYNDIFPIEADLNKLLENQMCTRPTVDYIGRALETVCAKQIELLKQKLKRRGLLQNLGKVEGNRELNAAVTEVLDILPHESVEYIHLCLRHYGYNSRSVIDALLDDTKMPLDLRRLHGQLLVATDVPDGRVASPLLSPALDQNDGFDYPIIDLRPDLPTADVPPQAVAARRHSGSQDALAGDIWPSSDAVDIPAHDDDERVAVPIRHGKKHGDLLSSMNDKTELKSFFDRLQFEDNGDNMYDDEYDDTYDGLGGDPIDARDEETTVTKFETARLNEQVQLVEETDALPASARARAQRAERAEQEPRPFTADYTGGRTRQLKERNKGLVAGHNRKSAASHKMRQGMF